MGGQGKQEGRKEGRKISAGQTLRPYKTSGRPRHVLQAVSAVSFPLPFRDLVHLRRKYVLTLSEPVAPLDGHAMFEKLFSDSYSISEDERGMAMIETEISIFLENFTNVKINKVLKKTNDKLQISLKQILL